MIRYSLICDNGHEFEGWFGNSQAFDDQARKRQLICPECGSYEVSKGLMAPNVKIRRAEKSSVVNKQVDESVRAAIRQIRDYVENNADYVGDQFAEEARKIHYEEVEARGIYGEATPDEATELKDEGVEYSIIPALPEDQN